MADDEAANVVEDGEEIGEEEGEGDDDLGEEVEEEDNAEDLYPLLDDEVEKDEEDQETYQEYLALTDEVDCQNQKITRIKTEIHDICKQSCHGKKEKTNLRNLHFCLQQELRHLEFMQLRAIRLQNAGAARLYDGLDLSTTLDEDMTRSPIMKIALSTVHNDAGETNTCSCDDDDDENDCDQ